MHLVCVWEFYLSVLHMDIYFMRTYSTYFSYIILTAYTRSFILYCDNPAKVNKIDFQQEPLHKNGLDNEIEKKMS